MSEKPPWRMAIEQFERSIGAPLEEFIKTEQFAELAAGAAKGQVKMQPGLEQSTSQWLHAMNLPAASDIADLRGEVAALRQEVRRLADALAKTVPEGAPEREPAAGKPKPKPKPAAAKPKPKPKPKPAAAKPKPKPSTKPTAGDPGDV